MRERLLDRFLHYVAIDTQSDPTSHTYPSTAKQLLLLNTLVEQMLEIGMRDVEIDAYGYVMGTVPATSGLEHLPAIGFISHVDTSPDMSGSGVRPQIIERYDGADIHLTGDITMKVSDFPELLSCVGHTLITTDGTTLLGADDKAGVAAIITAAEYLILHPDIAHGPVRMAFTPDEEIGHGVDHFDVARFAAAFAYTMDSSLEGEIEYENFNAAKADITIQGRNIHPGYAKGRMINALRVAMELDAALPAGQRPEDTEQYEGFYHLVSLGGGVDRAQVEYIIRDHSSAEFARKKETLQSIVDQVNSRYDSPIISLAIEDQYYNMRQMIEPHPEIMELAIAAMANLDITASIRPIRGGTDGARLSYMGLPCPNIFTGGANFHGRYEFASLNVMVLATRTIVEIVRLAAERGLPKL